MNTAVVIRGQVSQKAFVSNEPMPDIEGPAELVVYLPAAPATKPGGHSMFTAFGKVPHLRSAEDIDAQLAEERGSWDEDE